VVRRLLHITEVKRGAALGSPLAAYRCANKKAVGYAVCINMVPAGGFRGYGSSQTTFAIESAIDELARMPGIDPFVMRLKKMLRPGDWIESVSQRSLAAKFVVMHNTAQTAMMHPVEPGQGNETALQSRSRTS